MSAGALERTLALLRPGVAEVVRDGVVDVLSAELPVTPTIAQRTMQSRLLPLVYERIWRPIGFTLAAAGRGTGAEQRRVTQLLDARSDDVVLDVACGPGNTTRRMLDALGPHGLAVGLDAAQLMLAQAVAETRDDRVAYVHGDAADMPFADESFDAAQCLGALYLVEDAEAVIAELVRVVKPGGRIVVLTSCHRGHLPLRTAASVLAKPSGLRVFGRDEVTGAFSAHGLFDINQDVNGFMQLVGARKPEVVA